MPATRVQAEPGRTPPWVRAAGKAEVTNNLEGQVNPMSRSSALAERVHATLGLQILGELVDPVDPQGFQDPGQPEQCHCHVGRFQQVRADAAQAQGQDRRP